MTSAPDNFGVSGNKDVSICEKAPGSLGDIASAGKAQRQSQRFMEGMALAAQAKMAVEEEGE